MECRQGNNYKRKMALGHTSDGCAAAAEEGLHKQDTSVVAHKISNKVVCKDYM